MGPRSAGGAEPGDARADADLPGRRPVVGAIVDALDGGAGAIVGGQPGVGVSAVLRTVVRRLSAADEPVVVGTGSDLPPGTIVVVDEVDALDATVVDELARALLAGERRAVLGCTGRRPPNVRRLGSAGGLVEVEVPPLDLAGVAEVVTSIVGEPPGGILAVALLDDSGGLPGVLVPVVRAAVTAGVLRAEAGVTRRHGDLPLPSSIRDHYLSEVTQVTPGARAALQLLAVAGSLDEDAARRGFGLDHLVELEHAGLVVATDADPSRQVRPALGVVRRVVLADLGHFGLVEAATRLLERVPDAPSSLRTVWQLLADVTVDVDDLLLATASATDRGDLATALDLARAAWSEDPSRAGLPLARTMSALGDRAGAAEVLETVIDDRRLTPDDGAEAALELATLQLWNLDDEPGALALTQAVAEAAADTPLAAAGAAAFGAMLAYTGRSDEALATVEPHLGGAALGRGFALHVAAVALAVTGVGDRAVDVADAALASESDGIGPDPEVHALTAVLARELAGDLATADELAVAGYQRTTRVTVHHGWMALARTRVALVAGDLEHARRLALEAAAVFGDFDNHAPHRWALAGAMLASAQLGDEAGVTAALDDLDRLGPSAVSFLEPDVTRARAWAMAARGFLDDARRTIVDAARAAEATGSAALASTAWHDAVRLGVVGEPAARLAALADTVEGRWSRPRLLLADGRETGAVAALLEAAETFARLGAAVWAAESAALAESSARRAGARGDVRAARQAHRELRAGCPTAVTPALLDVPIATLTPRELDVARLVSDGYSSREVALRLGISVRTVDNLLQRSYDKLGIRRRQELRGALASDTA